MRKLVVSSVLLIIFLCIVALIYRVAKSAIVEDPAKKAALAGEIAPGAVPPSGFDTGEALTMGMRGVKYKDKSGERHLLLLESPSFKDKPRDLQTALRDSRARQDSKSHAVVDKESFPEMATHLGPIQVLQRQVHFPDGRSKIDFLVLAQNPRHTNKLITIMADAPVTPEEDGKFLADYLSHLEVAPWVTP